MKTRVSPLGRATAKKRRIVLNNLEKYVMSYVHQRTQPPVNSVMDLWHEGIVWDGTARLAPSIIQMMRSAESHPITRKYAEKAYNLVLRTNPLATSSPHSISKTRKREILAQVMLTEMRKWNKGGGISIWVQQHFTKGNPADWSIKPSTGGNQTSKQKDGIALEQPHEICGGGRHGTTIDYKTIPLNTSIPRRSAVKLDTGRWNMLGQSIAESANATRRAFVKRDCDNGMLDSRKLTEIGSGVNLDRVFMQQKPARSQKISVELLVDVSGSMETRDQKTNEQVITTAASMCKAIVEAFNKARVDCKVYAYNHKTFVAKEYKTRQVSWENLYCDGKTYMGHAMDTSLRSLRVRNADRKLMLVISDGDAGLMASDVAVTARTHRIETYGFFIGVPTPDEVSRAFTKAFGELSPTACVNEVCGAVRRSLAVA
jgi:hypothetical protein